MGSDFRSYSIDERGDEIIPITCNAGQYGLGKEISTNISINSVNSINNFLSQKHFTDVIDKYTSETI
jgi:hypothetical protein